MWAIDRYFAFSRMVIYTKTRKENNLAGVRGPQPLPAECDWKGWCDSFYGKYELSPRPVFYAVSPNNRDTLAVDCRIMQAAGFGRKVEPDWYLERGRHVFEEDDGGIRIDTAAVLAQGDYAWSEESGVTGESGKESASWQHCAGESFGRSGLVMYIRKPELRWTAEQAPSLNYRIQCQGGTYIIWMLSKFNVLEEGFFALGIDGDTIPRDELYGGGSLWRYEAEQIYRWVPAARIQLERGSHVLRVYALASGMRYDRFYLTRGEELPPADMEW